MLAVDADREGRGVADRFPALLVTGPPGVGKTAVAKEIREQLFHAGLPHAVIDLDELARIRPAVIDGSTFHADLVARNLRAIGRTTWRPGSSGWCSWSGHQAKASQVLRRMGWPPPT
jgi:adenylylsulfate kinase-like enzyme